MIHYGILDTQNIVTGDRAGRILTGVMPTRPIGRPPEGPHGATVRSLPRRTLRWPVEAEARLRAVCQVEDRTPWEVLGEAIKDYVDRLDASTKPLVQTLAKRHAAKLRKARHES